jgi:hypothetical protein
MDQFYFNTTKVLWRFIIVLLVSITFLVKFCIDDGSFIWLVFLIVFFGCLLLFTGRQLIAAIQKQPALIITDEYVFVFESRNALTFYLSATYYWQDISAFRKRLHMFSTGIDLIFDSDGDNWFTRKRNVNFNISIIDADTADIIASLDRHSLVPVAE